MYKMYNYDKLVGRIVERYTTREKFAKAMGFSARTLSLKLNNHVPWKDLEIERACGLLELSAMNIPAYFFAEKVQSLNSD